MPVSPKDLIRTWRQLQAARSNFDSEWEDIADLVLPNRRFQSHRSQGEPRRTSIFDNTAGEAHDRLVGQIYGLLTNPALRWFDLTISDPTLQDNPAVTLWLNQVRDIILHTLGDKRSRFYPALSEFYHDLAGFGTGAVFAQDRSATLQFKAVPLSDIWVEEDAMGMVDRVYRAIRMTPRQAFQAWGDNLPESVKERLDNPSQEEDEKDEYLHVVGPRDDRDPTSLGAKRHPVFSIVIHVKSKEVVHEGGFADRPFFVARWKKATGEVYGRGPAMVVLQEIRMVNAMARSAIIAAEKQADPPVQMPDSGFMGPAALHPGGINYYRMSAGNARIEPIATGARADIAEGLLDRHRELIRRGFFNDLFELPQLDRMTATEVMQRQQERMQMFSPTLIRLYGEMLDPCIQIAYHHLRRRGALPAPPDDMSNSQLEVQYTSPLARSQRASEPGGFGQWFASVSPLAQLDPTILDVVHPDRMARRLASALSVPEAGLRTDEEIAQVRQARLEQQQQMEQIQQAQGVAKAARDGAAAASELGGL